MRFFNVHMSRHIDMIRQTGDRGKMSLPSSPRFPDPSDHGRVDAKGSLVGSGLGNDPKPVRVASKLGNFKMLAKFRQPPGRRFLDQVGIAAVRENLRGGASGNREETHLLRDRAKIKHDGIDIIGLDVFEHVDATHQLRRLGRTVFREGRVVRAIVEVAFTETVESLLQILLAGAIVRKRFRF